MAAPTTDQRQECYVARDAFFQCMVENDEQAALCREQEKKYHSNCLASWVSHVQAWQAFRLMIEVVYIHVQVKYFNKKRMYENYKKKLEEDGYQPLPVNDDKK